MGKLQDIAPTASERVKIALQARHHMTRPDLAPLVTVEGGPPICDTSRALLASYGVTLWRTWKAATAAGLTVERSTGIEVNGASEKAMQAAWGWFVFPDRAPVRMPEMESSGVTVELHPVIAAAVRERAVDRATVPIKGTARPAPAGPSPAAMAEKWRTIADGLQKSINDAFRDRETNTPKRARQAGQAYNEGVQLERAQKAGRALAAAWEAGTVPDVLRTLASKADLVKLTREKICYSRGGYYDAGQRTGQPAWADDPRTAALWALLDVKPDPEREKAEALRKLLQDLQFAKIPGYFPTPADLVARMIEAANLEPESVVLEPSAGSGAIANALREAGHSPACIEYNHSLRQVLELQGHIVNLPHSFTDHQKPRDLDDMVDGVVMNPPFEKLQDIDHVTHALGFVKPGGRLVAIMSGMTPHRSCTKGRDFLELVKRNGGWFEDVPDGAFKESGTGVSTVMLVMERADLPEAPDRAPLPEKVEDTAASVVVLHQAEPARDLVAARAAPTGKKLPKLGSAAWHAMARAVGAPARLQPYGPGNDRPLDDVDRLHWKRLCLPIGTVQARKLEAERWNASVKGDPRMKNFRSISLAGITEQSVQELEDLRLQQARHELSLRSGPARAEMMAMASAIGGLAFMAAISDPTPGRLAA